MVKQRLCLQTATPATSAEGRKQSTAASSSRPQEPRALDLLSPGPHAAFREDIVSEEPVPEVDMQPNESPQSSSQPQQQVAPDLQQQDVRDERPGEVILPPAGAEEVALMPDRSGINVNGVQLTPASPIRSLRAACSYLGVSTSGGKAKLFDRILSFYDEQQLAVAQEIKASLGPSISAHEQRLIEPPTPAERREHELTHQPYQEWCESCIAARARPDAHKTDVHKVVDKAITSLSFDLSYTGKEFNPTGRPKLIDVEEAWKEKLIVLNGHDAHTGCLFFAPSAERRHEVYGT